MKVTPGELRVHQAVHHDTDVNTTCYTTCYVTVGTGARRERGDFATLSEGVTYMETILAKKEG